MQDMGNFNSVSDYQVQNSERTCWAVTEKM